MSTLKVASIVLAFISALLWLWSAKLKPTYPMAYLSGPPKEIVDRIKLQARLNASAAAVTGVSVLIGAISDVLSLS